MIRITTAGPQAINICIHMRKNTSICQYLEESPLETIRYRYMAAYLIYKQTKKSDKLMFQLNKYISQAGALGPGLEDE